LEATSNSKQNLNEKSKKQTTFEFGPNLLEVQIGLEKSDKFPKIIIFLEILEYEFRLTWFYGQI
jgi:hypothetical protein